MHHDATDPTRDITDLLDAADSMPPSASRNELIARAATMAARGDHTELAIQCHLMLVAGYVTSGDCTRVVAPFAWLSNTYRTHPELFSPDDVENLGWDYKYMFSVAHETPTVSVAQGEQLLEDFRTFYLQHGYTLRAWYFRCYTWHSTLGNTEQAAAALANWAAAPTGAMADCPGCDPSFAMIDHIATGDWEAAARAADIALASEEPQCDNNPEEILSLAMLPWLYTGQDARAYAAHKRAYRRYQQSPRDADGLAAQLRYLAISGAAGYPGRIDTGLRILMRHAPWLVHLSTPRSLLGFATEATLLLTQAAATDPDKVLTMHLPGQTLPWSTQPDLDNPTTSAARDWFHTLARDLAQRFDTRPGHPHPGIEARRLDEALNPDPAPAAPPAPAVPDIAGVYGEADTDLTIADSPHLTQKTTAATPSPADTPTAEETNTPPRVPVPITGDWATMSLDELLAQPSDIIVHPDSIYLLAAREKIATDATLSQPDGYQKLGDPHAAGLWWLATNRLLSDAFGKEITPEEEHFDAACNHIDAADDAAARFMMHAIDHYRQGQYRQAAIAADTATRTPSADPLGIRLVALDMLYNAARAAGYREEGVDNLRQLVNLSAAANLPCLYAIHAATLAGELRRLDRHHEAADVAHNALDHLDTLTLGDGILSEVYEQLTTALVDALTDLEHHTAAGQQLMRQARRAHARNRLVLASILQSNAAESFNKAGEHELCYTAADESARNGRRVIEALSTGDTSLEYPESWTTDMDLPGGIGERAIAHVINTLRNAVDSRLITPGPVPEAQQPLVLDYLGEWERAITHPLRGEPSEETIADDTVELLQEYAAAYYRFEDYPQAIGYSEQSIDLSHRVMPGSDTHIGAWATHARMLAAMDDLPAAHDAAVRCLDLAAEVPDTPATIIRDMHFIIGRATGQN